MADEEEKAEKAAFTAFLCFLRTEYFCSFSWDYIDVQIFKAYFQLSTTTTHYPIPITDN